MVTSKPSKPDPQVRFLPLPPIENCRLLFVDIFFIFIVDGKGPDETGQSIRLCDVGKLLLTNSTNSNRGCVAQFAKNSFVGATSSTKNIATSSTVMLKEMNELTKGDKFQNAKYLSREDREGNCATKTIFYILVLNPLRFCD